jgi:methanogenic corrinoid protein MtbC1
MQTPALVPSVDIEYETGFSSDLLRKWRSRYGFPVQEVVADVKAGYSRETVNRLLLIKRLLEKGFQPVQVISRSPLDLERLHQSIADDAPNLSFNETSKKLLERLKDVDPIGFQALLAKARTRGTMTDFVTDTVGPLLVQVGVAWRKREIEIYHEHLCTSIIERYLHAEILLCKPKRGFPKIILATPPEEQHNLGLLMSEAALAEQGAKTINLGRNIPLNDLKLAAISCQADIVMLSFSLAISARRVRPILTHLRHILPDDVEIWAGGKGVDIIRHPQSGVRIFLNFEDMIVALHEFAKHKRK